MSLFTRATFFALLIVTYGFSSIHTSQASQVVLSDPLTSWPLNFGTQSDNILLKNGAVHIAGNGATSAAYWEIYTGFSFTDMDATVTMTSQTATGGGGGLIFWAAPNQQDFFELSIGDVQGSFAVVRWNSAGGWQHITPFAQNSAIKSGVGAVNVLRVVTKGNSAAIFINGQSIGSLAVQAPAGGGSVGFEGELGAGQPADYSYSNLSVSQ